MPQKNYVSHYDHLKNKWTDRHRELEKTLWEKHKDAFVWIRHNVKHFTLGSLGGLVLFTTPVAAASLSAQSAPPAYEKLITNIDKRVFLISDLSHILPESVQPLTPSQEDVIGQILTRHFGFHVSAELQGIKLNRSYGYIGAEQHLALYPGDSLYTHFSRQEEAQLFTSNGMAPGLGAWRYFAPSKSQLTEKDILREKYYIAVQTFLSPGYNDNVKEYNDFYRYRKMIVVNPENGKAIVADIADSGPSDWTGKQLGGSPEVMQYLERYDGAQKGPVLYFFIDDPRDEIPLGPVQIK